jgi:hypothetical protein
MFDSHTKLNISDFDLVSVLGAFGKYGESNVGFSPVIYMKELGCHWVNFNET